MVTKKKAPPKRAREAATARRAPKSAEATQVTSAGAKRAGPARDGSGPLEARSPAIACLELATVARGVVALDQILKRAEVTVVAARTISPGRYLIVLTAPEAELEEAMDAGLSTAKEDLVDSLVLFDPSADLRDALSSTLDVTLGESLAIVETTTVSSALSAAERALKDSDVRLVDLRLGAGLSGKGVFSFTGALHMVEAARAAIEAFVAAERIVRIELIAQPHPELPRHLLLAEPAIVRGPRDA
ncbi:MAG: BMC domain-containing protein [Deltaproteobacteria bacterium]|nr:BMC domain-containing protein [Deltaproteobacteria bacterium]